MVEMFAGQNICSFTFENPSYTMRLLSRWGVNTTAHALLYSKWLLATQQVYNAALEIEVEMLKYEMEYEGIHSYASLEPVADTMRAIDGEDTRCE